MDALLLVEVAGHSLTGGGVGGTDVVEPVAESHQLLAHGQRVQDHHLILRRHGGHGHQRAGVGADDQRCVVELDILGNVRGCYVRGGLTVVDHQLDLIAQRSKLVGHVFQCDHAAGIHGLA